MLIQTIHAFLLVVLLAWLAIGGEIGCQVVVDGVSHTVVVSVLH